MVAVGLIEEVVEGGGENEVLADLAAATKTEEEEGWGARGRDAGGIGGIGGIEAGGFAVGEADELGPQTAVGGLPADTGVACEGSDLAEGLRLDLGGVADELVGDAFDPGGSRLRLTPRSSA